MQSLRRGREKNQRNNLRKLPRIEDPSFHLKEKKKGPLDTTAQWMVTLQGLDNEMVKQGEQRFLQDTRDTKIWV